MSFDTSEGSGEMPDWDEVWHELVGNMGDMPGQRTDAYGGVDGDMLPDQVAAEAVLPTELTDQPIPLSTSEQVSPPENMPTEVVRERIQEDVTAVIFEEANRDKYIGPAIAGLANQAAEAGDIEAVDKYVDLIQDVYSVSDAPIIYTYCSGVSAGSERAAALLNDTLAKEKTEAGHLASTWRSDPEQYVVDPHSSQNKLFNAANALAEQGISPEALIEKYAVDDEHRWTVTNAHLEHMAANYPGEGEYAEAHDVHIADLADNPAHSDDFLFSQMSNALRATGSADVRDRLADRLVRLEIPLTIETYEEYIRISEQLLREPGLAERNPERAAHLDQTITRCAGVLEQAGVPSYATQRKLMSWNLATTGYNGIDAPSRVAIFDEQTAAVLAAAGDDEILKERALWDRDSLLGNAAADYAEAADFQSARAVLATIANDGQRLNGVRKCLEKARVPADVETIRPDQMTIDINPEIAIELELTTTRVSGDPEIISLVGLECARSPVGNSNHAKEFFAPKAYRTIAAIDKPRALQFAREAVAAMRGASRRYPEMIELSEILIIAGDPNEAQHAYQHIMRTSKGSQRVHNLWRLARFIDGDPMTM